MNFHRSGIKWELCDPIGRLMTALRRRVDEASRQKDLFVEPAPKLEKTGMDL
jgi:hypothetical protein